MHMLADAGERARNQNKVSGEKPSGRRCILLDL